MRDNLPNLVRVAVLRQVDGILLCGEEADACILEDLDVPFNIVQLELLFLCFRAQRAQCKLYGERPALLRPEESERLLLQCACMAQSAEQHRADGDEHCDRDDDHECVCCEQFRL